MHLLQLLTVNIHTTIVKKTLVEKWLAAIISIASMAISGLLSEQLDFKKS